MRIPHTVQDLEERTEAARTVQHLLDAAARLAPAVRDGLIPPGAGIIWLSVIARVAAGPGLFERLGSYRDGHPPCPGWMVEILERCMTAEAA